ncbi:MAG: hypothetical protein QGF46_03905, partial [Planctomycetota bacterium]|nr:hypothetical protein [Planctomycetota bacterium]
MLTNQRIWTLLLPAITAVLLFAHTYSGDFVYDDRTILELNPNFQTLAIIPDAFTTPYWELVSEDAFAVGFYRPLAASFFAASWVVSDGNPHFFHLVSILLHAACAVALTSLCLALGWRPKIACMAGTLFAILGCHAEAIAWISSQPDLLATLLTLIGMRCFVTEREYRAPLFMFLALACKESPLAIVILCILTALVLRRKLWPWILMLGLYYLLRANAFDSWSAGFDRVNTHHGLSRVEQIILGFKLLGQHLGFMAVPFGHAPFHPLKLGQGALAPQNILPAIGAVIAIFIAIGMWRRRSADSPSIRVGLGLMFMGVAPVLNTFALGQYPFAERFGYLASTGFCILTVISLTRLQYRGLAICAAIVIVVGNGYSSYSGSKNWRNEADLFRWAQRVSPNAMTGHVEFGRLMLEKAQQTTEPNKRAAFAELALEAYSNCDGIDVDKVFCTSIERYKSNIGKADALFFVGETDNAKKVYQLAIDHYGHAPEAFLGIGNCSSTQAFEYWQNAKNIVAKNQYTAAVHAYNTALEQNPDISAALAGKAKALVQLVNI